MNKEIDHMKAVIARHRRKMKKKEEGGDDIGMIVLIFVFLTFFGGYISCLATAVAHK